MTPAILLALTWLISGADPAARADQERDRQQSVAAMAPAKARLLTVSVVTDKPATAKLHPEPLLRWSNATAGSIYGEVFLWSMDDRPVAIASIYRWFHPFKDSTLEIVSLSESPVELQEAGDIWKSPARGVTLRPVPDAPTPATTRGMRLSQMRGLARGFSAELADDRGGELVNRDLRLLNQPIHRYSSERIHIIDGAIFAFVEATDPEALLILEAVQAGDQTQWRFALARMNAHGMTIRRDRAAIQSWERVTDPARDPHSPYAFFNFDPDLVTADKLCPTAP